jgi:hypothetical protein
VALFERTTSIAIGFALPTIAHHRALRRDQLRHRGPVGVELAAEVGDVVDRFLDLGNQVFAVVDDLVGAQLLHPGDGLGPRKRWR